MMIAQTFIERVKGDVRMRLSVRQLRVEHAPYAALILPHSQIWEDGRCSFSADFREFGSLWELGREKQQIPRVRARTRVTHARARARTY